jgi:hypothetical protein
MFARALRCQKLSDIYSGQRHILQTLTKDPTSGRVRSIRPGENVENMWDSMNHTEDISDGVPVWGVGSKEAQEAFVARYTYSEADKLEDAALWIEEVDGEMTDNLAQDSRRVMERWEVDPDINLLRADLDTDEEGSEPDDGGSGQSKPAALIDDDGDLDSSSDSSSDEDDSLGDSVQALKLSGSCDQLIKLAANSLASRARHTSLEVLDYLMPILRNPDNAPELPISLQTRSAALMRILRAALRNARGDDNESKYTLNENMRNILHRRHDRYLDKSMSTKSMSARTVLIFFFTVCKLEFHLAGTDRKPYYYTQLRGIINAMDRFIMAKDIVDTGLFELMKFMKIERRIVGDAFKRMLPLPCFTRLGRSQCPSTTRSYTTSCTAMSFGLSILLTEGLTEAARTCQKSSGRTLTSWRKTTPRQNAISQSTSTHLNGAK